jgi:hypothetical protein
MKILPPYLLLLITLPHSSHAQLPVKQIDNEIRLLKTADEKEAYWEKLLHLDQEVLLNTEDRERNDSIALENMYRTALMFEIHGVEAYAMNNTVPILNLAHNQIAEAQIAFWPIILQCATKGGIIQSFGGTYPAYQLESISLPFYNYSLVNKEALYPSLLNKVRVDNSTSVSKSIIRIFEKQKKLQKLQRKKSLGKWKNQPLKDIEEDVFFEIVQMSDGKIYISNNGRIQALERIKTTSELTFYRIAGEPFGWYYALGTDGTLSLLNDNNEILIRYNKA